jgi:diacylglycerol kinase family enzyme
MVEGVSSDLLPAAGLLSEAFAGLAANADPAAALLPLAAIPAGTGNAIAMSLASLAGEECSPLSATLAALCCAAPLALDAAIVRQLGSAREMRSLLSLSWALIADIDIESEALRFLGPARFTVQALLRCALLRRYDGKLVYKPGPHAASPPGRPATLAEAALAGNTGVCAGWLTLEGPFESLWALNLPWGSQDAMPAPGALPSDGCYDVVLFRGGSPLATAAALIALETGDHVGHACVTVVKATEFVLLPGKPQGGTAGILVLDGEKVAAAKPRPDEELPLLYAPLHVRVQRGAARILARAALAPRDLSAKLEV